MRRLLAALILLALPVAVAHGADPSSGKVSAASPTVSWKGTLVHPYPYHLAFAEEPAAGRTGQTPCDAPACDSFTLEVAESADLTLTVQSEQTNDMSLRIQQPDGTWQYVDGWSDGSKPTTVKFKKAATGKWLIEVVARVFGTGNPTAVDDTADYVGTAKLAVAPPPVAAPAPAPAVATPAPAPAPAAKPAAKPKQSCAAKARKIRSAKKRKAALRRCRRH